MKLYLKVVVLIIVLIALLGFVLPYLFSAESDLAVGLGVTLCIIAIPSLYYLVRSIVKSIKQLKK